MSINVAALARSESEKTSTAETIVVEATNQKKKGSFAQPTAV